MTHKPSDKQCTATSENKGSRYVVEASIEAAKATNEKTWEQSSECVAAPVWEENEEHRREPVGSSIRRKQH